MSEIPNQKAPENVLYHYTTAQGAQGILSSQSIWMSDCQFLNDRDEFNKATDLFIESLPVNRKTPVSQALTTVGGMLRRYCVFSLSKSPEILSQWRAYADDGHGFSLGFSKKFLTYALKKNDGVIFDCVYENHQSFIDDLIKRLEPEICHLCEQFDEARGASNTYMSLLRNDPHALDSIMFELLKLKNPAFSEEMEIRAICARQHDSVITRTSERLLVPYTDIAFWDNEDSNDMWVIIPEVWIGPKADERNKYALQSFLQLGWSLGGIKKFDCGYR